MNDYKEDAPVETLDRRIIARLCADIDDTLYPFLALAAEFGMAEEELLARVRSYRERGLLRRFGAILRHQQAGMVANGMSVWAVPTEAVERVGAIMAAQPEVSHCYERLALPEWPYNLYAMIHAHTEDEVRQVTARIAAETGIADYAILFSVREFKKTSMVYTAL